MQLTPWRVTIRGSWHTLIRWHTLFKAGPRAICPRQFLVRDNVPAPRPRHTTWNNCAPKLVTLNDRGSDTPQLFTNTHLDTLPAGGRFRQRDTDDPPHN